MARKIETYKDGFPIKWFGGDPNETVCGAGSMVANMGPVIKWLSSVVKDGSVIELGCGDLNFAKNAVFENCYSYVGYDIQKRDSWDEAWIRESPRISLYEANILDLTNISADIIIARDVFIHLTNEQTLSILGNLKFELLVSTTYFGANNKKRMNSPSAGFQALDLTTAPFNLNCELLIQEHAANKFLGVFTR